MIAFEWHSVVLQPTRTWLHEDIARTAALGCDTAGSEALVLHVPYIVRERDVLKITGRRSILDRLRRSLPPPPELMLVRHAGSTFTWVSRGWGGSRRGAWRKGDRVEVISHVPQGHRVDPWGPLT